MDPNLIPILIVLFLLWLLWLLWQLLKIISDRQSDKPQESDGNSRGALQRYLEQQQKEEAQKTAGLKELLGAAKSADPEKKELAQKALQQLLKQAGINTSELQDVSQESELVKKLAAKLNLEAVLGYSEALNVDLPEIKARKTEAKERSLFPTLDSGMETAYTPEDMLGATPEELYQRDQTYQKLADGELQVVSYYRSQVTEAVLHMVIDVSGSMSEPMQSGILKRVLARAVAYRLLTRASQGKAKFLLRFYDGDVHPLHTANNAGEAAKLAKLVSDKGFSGSGTEILGALKQAVKDIENATAKNPRFVAEIMLITDGQPNTPFSEAQLRKVLGDVKLHVMMIGDENNAVLETVATSFYRMN